MTGTSILCKGSPSDPQMIDGPADQHEGEPAGALDRVAKDLVDHDPQGTNDEHGRHDRKPEHSVPRRIVGTAPEQEQAGRHRREENPLGVHHPREQLLVGARRHQYARPHRLERDRPSGENITAPGMKAPPPRPSNASAASAAIRVERATSSRGNTYRYTALSATYQAVTISVPQISACGM